MFGKQPSSIRPSAFSGPVYRLSDSQVWRLAREFTQIVWRCTADGRHFVAPNWTLLTGQTPAELDNDGWLHRVHPEDRGTVAAEWTEAIAGGTEFASEFRVELEDGTYEWFRARGEPLRNRRGDVKSWVGITTNIDEQRRAEEEVRDSAARLALIVDSARVGTLDWSLDADHIDVNPRALEMLGLDPMRTMTFEDIERVTHPEDRARVRQAIEEALDPSGPGTFDVTFRVPQSGGQTKWLAARGRVRFIDDTTRRLGVRLLGVLADLTREMRELEDLAWLSTLVTSSNDAIIAKTPDGVITHWNAAAERIFGYTAAEMTGQSVYRIVPPDEATEMAALLDSVRMGGEVTNVVTERLSKDGRRITVALTLSAIRDVGGTVVGISAIERDITSDRFRDEQLREAQKLEAVGQLAGGVAHDLNNVLTAMMAGVHLVIQNSDIDDRARGRLVQVRDECFRASSVIRELLAFGRKQVVTPQTCGPNDIVSEAEPMLRRLIGEDIALVVHAHAQGSIFVDRAQLLQVLVSLAVHARDSMPEGGEMTITTSDEAVGAVRRVVLTLSDTGVGITAETRARLFEPYFTTRKLGWGTGLGLSVVHGIISQFGGEITVESEAGQGTTFRIVLPAVDTPSTNLIVQENIPTDLRGDETILFVEDERVVRDQLAEALRQFGYTVLEARNGYDALTVLEKHNAPVHLVLSDVVMPEMSGGALVAQLREWYPSLRVLFITGYSEEAVASYGVVVSNTALLMKPFVVTELAKEVRAVLDGPRQGDRSPNGTPPRQLAVS
jgi:PAS domain S-box-containing protein